MKKYLVETESAGQRADIFVAEKYPEYSRSALRGLFDKSRININDKTGKPGYKLRLGDKVIVNTDMLRPTRKSIHLPVIYEDKDVVVMDKPAGVLTHSKGALNQEPTVASFLSRKISDKSLRGNRAGIVHRLDRATSGIIIGAKNQRAQKWLQKLFATRKVKKTYFAIVKGVIEPDEAIIEAPIARNSRKPHTFKVSASGKSARTEYKLLRTIEKDGRQYSLVELRPITGRTHQLRVHLAYIGHPVVGDTAYGSGGENLYLHAGELELTLPGGEQRVFTAPLPKIFKELPAA